jgi:DNA-binding MarR family transcriptional regulator
MAKPVSSPAADRRLRAADHLHSAAIHLLRRVRREDERTGVGPAQLSALSVLVFGGPRTLGELARVEGVRPPTITRIVAALERAGLVERRPDAADRRVTRVRATPRGTRLMSQGRGRRVATLATLLGNLTAEDVDHLDRAAALIERALQGTRDGGGSQGGGVRLPAG